MATDSEKAVDFKRSPSGAWTLRVREAFVIAAITAAASGGATRCAMPASAEDVRELKVTIAKVDTNVSTLAATVAKEAQESRNRDVIQDAAISAIRNR